jgi:metal-responsive CopG/Arc/MetJ family transcriptional regulator
MREPITISLEAEIIEQIDGSKGKNEPRSRFLEDIVIEYLKKSKANKGAKQ